MYYRLIVSCVLGADSPVTVVLTFQSMNMINIVLYYQHVLEVQLNFCAKIALEIFISFSNQ